jgi:hemoglobin
MGFGGPSNYTGKDMREGHKHLNLTEEHFQAVAGNLKATLEELNVPSDLIDQVMAIAASTHDDVLNL